MNKKLMLLMTAVSFLMALTLLVPVYAWTYPDCSSDTRYETFGPRLDRLFIKLYASDVAEFTAMESGEIDMVEWPLPEEYVTKWTTQSPYKENIKVISYGAEFGMFIIDINCLPVYVGDYERHMQGFPNPTSSKVLRHALWHLMDRDYVVANIWGGMGVPMYTPVPPSMGIYVHPEIRPGGALEVLTHPYDPTYAAQILDESGEFPIGDDGWRFWDRDGDGVEDPDEGMGPGEPCELWFYIRAEHALRRELGLWLAEQIETYLKISVNERLLDFYGCWQPVMLEHEFNLYTGGWSLGPEPDHLVLYQSYYYWYPGFCYNYGGMNCSTYDYWVDQLLFANTFEEAKYATWMAQEVFCDPHVPEGGHEPLCTCENGAMGCIPVVANEGYKAVWRRYTGGTATSPQGDEEDVYRGQLWKQIVNVPGYGCDSGFSFMNMYPEGHPLGDGEHMTLRWGFKVDKLVKYGNPVYAEWMWDWNVMGLIYESPLYRDPYTFEWKPWLIKNFEVFTWEDPVTHETKSGVRFYLRNDVYWQDGTLMTAADYVWTMIEMPKALEEAGLPPPWWQENVAYIQSFYLIDPFTIEMLLNVKSVWAVGWIGGCTILPKHIWEPLIEAHVRGEVDLTGPAPEVDYFGTYTGSGPYRFVEYVEGSHVWLERNPLYFRSCPIHVNAHITAPAEYEYKTKVPPENLPVTVTVTLHNDWINPIPNTAEGEATGNLTVTKYVWIVYPNGTEVQVAYEPGIILPYCVDHVEQFTVNEAGYFTVKVAVHVDGPETIEVTKEGEVITVPNPWVCQWINYSFPFWVTLKEDITGSYYYTSQLPAPDCKVSGLDVTYAARAFGSYPGHPRWFSPADVNGNYKGDGVDLTMICRKFGWGA